MANERAVIRDRLAAPVGANVSRACDFVIILKECPIEAMKYLA